ncbi:hypothetical protein D6T65_14765 [Arthrobacter frigidicola]|nr:hypothetical protein D6T65_14765 [Arthrobacter frigidicola]
MPIRPILPAGTASGSRPGGTGTGAPRASDGRRMLLARRIRLLVAATITYNALEAVVALGAGTVASSGALLAFGLDSVVEVLSAAAVAWQFAAPDPEAREPKALRFIAFSFFGLAAFVTIDAVRALAGGSEAQHSPVGIALAAASLVVMPFLSLAQRRAGRELGSRSAVADSKQTLLCTYLSAVLLGGLLLNSTLGWSWADPIAALIIAAVAVKEGREAWKGDTCCAVPTASAAASAAEPAGRTAGGPGEGPVPAATDAPSCSCCPGEPAEPST